MGTICVKNNDHDQLYSNRNKKEISSNQNTIKTKMDKQQYKRLQIIKQFLSPDQIPMGLSATQQKQQRQIGDFKFIRHLGDGSYGEVLMVRDKKSQHFYAMKIVRKQLVISREQILNALSQRYILAAMDHPFVVKLHYAFQTKNKIYLIVDLMAGGELFFLLRKNKKFTEQATKIYAAEILLALQYLHSKKIIYRDLKPENVLLTGDGHIKLTDFGLSKVCLKKNQVATSVCGTPEYIAPEVLKGKGYTIAADWFSFGSLLYDMLTGKPPFYSKDKQEMMLKIQTKQVPLPESLSAQAKSLLKGLFERKQQNRLGFKTGATEIKQHQFFKSINFDDIYHKRIKPPFQFGQRQFDINNQGFAVKYDQFEMEESYQKELVQKSKGVNFQGFTYQVKQQKQQLNIQIGDDKSYRSKKQPQSNPHLNSLNQNSLKLSVGQSFQKSKENERKANQSIKQTQLNPVNKQMIKERNQQNETDTKSKQTNSEKKQRKSVFSLSINQSLKKKSNQSKSNQTQQERQLEPTIQQLQVVQKKVFADEQAVETQQTADQSTHHFNQGYNISFGMNPIASIVKEKLQGNQ